MADILYVYGESLYVNLTNQCPCRCVFCIRSQQEGLGTADSLWLEHAPTAQEVLKELESYDLSRYPELIFCGYGEPLCALDTLVEVCRKVREISPIKIRINTNGLGDLIQGKPTLPLLAGLVDALSISLNAPDPQSYQKVTRPEFGPESFQAMLDFARAAKEVIPEVKFSVVDVIPPEQVQACQTLADSMGIPLRVRHFVKE